MSSEMNDDVANSADADETPVGGPANSQQSIDRIIERLRESALFDPAYFTRFSSDVPEGVDLLTHYVMSGESAGHQPNFLFNPSWYRKRYDVAAFEPSLLLHYLSVGERSGYAPSPLFDPKWYAENVGIDLEKNCGLAHYLAADPHKRSPHAYFSGPHYVTMYPDIAMASVDPYVHYLEWGVFENRKGSENFDANYVWKQYLNNDRSKNSLSIFMEFHKTFGWSPKASEDLSTVHREVRRYNSPAPEFEQLPRIILRNGMELRQVISKCLDLPKT